MILVPTSLKNTPFLQDWQFLALPNLKSVVPKLREGVLMWGAVSTSSPTPCFKSISHELK